MSSSPFPQPPNKLFLYPVLAFILKFSLLSLSLSLFLSFSLSLFFSFLSFSLLVRGSVPLVWQQQINLKYEPSIEVHDPQDEVSQKVFLHHFEKQLAIYGKQTIVNLLKKSGSESRLGTAYEVLFHKCDEHKDSGRLSYHAFDLHKECGKRQHDTPPLPFNHLYC